MFRPYRVLKCMLTGHEKAKLAYAFEHDMYSLTVTRVRVWMCPYCHHIYGKVNPTDKITRDDYIDGDE